MTINQIGNCDLPSKLFDSGQLTHQLPLTIYKEKTVNQYEREEAQLEQDLAEGRISQAEYNKQGLEMEKSYRAEMREMAQEAADRAYDDVMGGW